MWDKKNKPIGYIVGVTPGFSQFEPGNLRLVYMGLARKITKAARLGFEFAQIDFEELGEAIEPEIVDQIKRIKEAQNIEIGIHLHYAADFTLAYAFEWRYNQDQLRICAKIAGESNAKYILFHSSSHMRPNITSAFLGRREAYGKLVGPDGTNLGIWIEKNGMKDWFMAKFIRVLFSAMGVAGNPAVIDYFETKESFKEARKYAENVYERGIAAVEEELMRIRARIEDLERLSRIKGLTAEEKKEFERLLEEYKQKSTREYLIRKTALVNNISEQEASVCLAVARYTIEYDFDGIYDFWVRQGSEGEEYIAYLSVAEYMFRKKDKIWSMITKINESPYNIAREASRKLGELKDEEVEKLKKIVAAVAAKYIEGHLFAKSEQYGIRVGEKILSVYEYCKEKNVRIYIETAMPEKGAEGELRIMSVLDHINACKAIDNGELINYCIDFEHLLTNLIDPIKEAEKLLREQPGDGKYISCLHINAPRPIIGAHGPIQMISHDMFIIYKFLYILRKAGVKDSYIIWEMGSFGVEQSAIALKKIVNELLKETEPENLSAEFYGIDKDFEARQRAAILEHALDPIRDLLVMPEDRFSIIGKRAAERGKGREWERERYR
jgi:sugar phosphate isomerase/epimerase